MFVIFTYNEYKMPEYLKLSGGFTLYKDQAKVFFSLEIAKQNAEWYGCYIEEINRI